MIFTFSICYKFDRVVLKAKRMQMEKWTSLHKGMIMSEAMILNPYID